MLEVPRNGRRASSEDCGGVRIRFASRDSGQYLGFTLRQTEHPQARRIYVRSRLIEEQEGLSGIREELHPQIVPFLLDNER